VCAQGSSGAAPAVATASAATPAAKTPSSPESDYHAQLQALAANAR
jgi:hypothetical protein